MDLPLALEVLFLSRHIPYSPSDPSIYTPPYPISPCDPIISIICHSCHVRLDHYCVIFTAGPVNSLVLKVVRTAAIDNSGNIQLTLCRMIKKGKSRAKCNQKSTLELTICSSHGQ